MSGDNDIQDMVNFGANQSCSKPACANRTFRESWKIKDTKTMMKLSYILTHHKKFWLLWVGLDHWHIKLFIFRHGAYMRIYFLLVFFIYSNIYTFYDCMYRLFICVKIILTSHVLFKSSSRHPGVSNMPPCSFGTQQAPLRAPSGRCSTFSCLGGLSLKLLTH
jgi:hypothetical protein